MYLGIDFGTSTNYITRVTNTGEIRKVENVGSSFGADSIFNNVIYYESDTNFIIGSAAINRRSAEPHNFVGEVKRKLEQDDWSQPIKSLEKNLNALEIATDIFKEIKTRIETNEGGNAIEGVVISVPFAFQHTERQKIKKAAEDAGLNVLGLIEEPVAAALCFGLFDDTASTESEKVLIFDLGGGTFDVTIFEFSKTTEGDISIEVLNTDGDKNLGGKDIDDLILKRLKEKLPYNIDEIQDEKQMRKEYLELSKEAERVKINLSQYEDENVFIGNLYNGNTLDLDITRDDLSDWIRKEGFISKINNTLDRSLIEVDLEPEDIDRIILVGGTSNIPIIKELVETFFNKKPELIKNPRELVGEGAGIYCRQLINNQGKLNITRKISYSIGVNSGNRFTPLIARNSKYEEFSDRKEYVIKNNNKCAIKVYQGNSYDLQRCSYTGSIEIDPAQDLLDNKLWLELGTDPNGIVKYRVYNSNHDLIKDGEL